MKKYTILLVGLLFVTLFTGCAPEKVDETLLTAPEEVLAPAYNAYSLFEINTLTADSADTKDVDGMPYARVKDERYKTLADLEAYLKDTFSGDIVKDLLSRNLYMDIDGSLYALEAARGTNALIGNVSYDVTVKNANKVTYTAKVDLLDAPGGTVTGTKDFTFVREKKDGKWIFTTFEYFW